MNYTIKPNLPTQGTTRTNRHETGVRRYTAWPSEHIDSGFWQMDCSSWAECVDTAMETRNAAALRCAARWSQCYTSRMVAKSWCEYLRCDALPAIRVTFVAVSR
jgi:hypothetical protein